MALALIGGSLMLCASAARTQTARPKQNTTHVISDQDISLLWKDLRSKRKQIAPNLKLPAEASKFCSVCDQYISELIAINDEKFTLIQNYADIWGKICDDESWQFIRQWMHLDTAAAQSCQKYVPIVSEVPAGKRRLPSRN